MVRKMKAIKKTLLLTVLMLVTLVGSAFATPITVDNINIQEKEGDYVVLVTLANANVTSGKYDDLVFEISELGTSKNMGVVTVDSATKTFTYKLTEITDSYDSLKKGTSYTITAKTDSNSVYETFLFGKKKDTSGLDIVIENVKVNSEEITNNDVLSVLNGQNLKVDLRFTALGDFDDSRIRVFIEGYEHASLSEETEIFGVVKGKTYSKSIEITLPADMDNQKDYKLRITGANDLSGLLTKEYTLYVDTQRHRVDILDMITTPSSGVEPGQNVIANLRVKNRGQKSQDSVKVMVTIPELGISESSYVSNLNPEKVITSDDMLLFIPENAEAGEYEVIAKLAYDDGYTTSTETFRLNVLAPKIVKEKNLLVSFANNQDLVAGETRSFDVVIANPNDESKPISLSAIDNAWADVEITPSLAMVKAGDSQTFTVKVTPKTSVAGEKSLALLVKEGSKTISEVNVNTYVEGKDSIDLVQIALAVLLVIAIIILLSLVISSIRRRKEDNEEDMSSTEEYY